MKMDVVELIRERYVVFIPPIVSCLGSANQKNRTPQRIERIKHPIGSTCMLDPKLPHMGVSRAVDARTVRMLESRTILFEQTDIGCHRGLLGFVKTIPPLTKFVCVFYLAKCPHIPPKEYSIKRMKLVLGHPADGGFRYGAAEYQVPVEMIFSRRK